MYLTDEFEKRLVKLKVVRFGDYEYYARYWVWVKVE